MRAVKTLSVAVLCALLPTAAPAGESARSMWQEFRAAHPYHLQVMGLSRMLGDGTRVLILSEPPPHVTIDGLQQCAGQAFGSLAVEKQPIGHDGWVKDVVVTLPPLDAPALRELLDRVHDYLFHTTYKADMLDLPAGPLPITQGAELDIRVSAPDLKRWTVDEREAFRPVEGGKPMSLEEILDSRRSGVFLSRSRGLVVWSLPQGADLARHRARARQFAVDTDLLLGAIGRADHVAIVGRERATPIRAMPPLRVETIELLASVGASDELAQSYERNRIFAGRFDDEWDWAPIYLSRALINTEYGSLLNITDQLLKSWSMNGLIEYERFGYPKPADWPFSQPLIRELGAESVTFNWNTAGAGYAMDTGGLSVQALNRTGALPVSYIPESEGPGQTGQANPTGKAERERLARLKVEKEKARKCEFTAYDYFAARGDPNLARVVQYAGLYQIFHNFGFGATAGGHGSDIQARADKNLAADVLSTLHAIRKADDRRLKEIAATIARKVAKRGGKASPEVVLFLISMRVNELDKKLDALHEIWGDEGVSELASCWANPRALNAADLTTLADEMHKLTPEGGRPSRAQLHGSLAARKYVALIMARELMADSLVKVVIHEFADIDAVRTRYSEPFGDQPEGWIRTPSIVVSRATGVVSTLTGGHNLDAGITAFRAERGLAAGDLKEVLVDGKRVILYGEGDAARIPNLVKIAGKEAHNPELLSILKARLPDVRPVDLARADLFVPDFVPPPVRGYMPVSIEAKGLGWTEAAPKPLTAAEQLLAESPRASKSPTLTVARRGDAYMVFTADDAAPFEAKTKTSLVEFLTTKRLAVPAESELHLEFNGFEPQEVRGLVKSCRVRALREGAGDGEMRLVSRSIRSGARTDAATFEARLLEVDLRSAKISEPVFGEVNGRAVATIDVAVPARVAGKPSLLLRIHVFFEKLLGSVTDLVKTQVRQVVERFLRSIGENAELLDGALLRMRSELKPYGLEDALHDLQIELYEQGAPTQTELSDWLLVEQSGRVSHERAARRTG
jgi:hypothetical protein